MPKSIDMKRFEQLKTTGELPSPRGVALAIIRLTRSGDVSMAELARVIRGDPAFVGRLIKAANGVVAENRRAVVSVQEALMVLGLPAVRALALGFSLLSNYRKGGCAGFDYTRFWASSLVMALSMQALTQRVRVLPADEAFCLGLLARIGELALATLHPPEFARVLGEVQGAPGRRQVELEKDRFAMDHCELGAAMLTDWGVPAVLASAVLHFEQPEASGLAEGSREAGLVRCLALSRAIAQICLAPEVEHARLMTATVRQARVLGIARDEFVTMCERVGGEWGEWGKLLQIETETVPRFGELSEAGAEAPAGPATAVTDDDAGRQGERMRVLVVEPDEGRRARLRLELEAAALRVFETRSVGDAIEAAMDVQPQLMLMDWGAHAGGQALIRALRETRLGRNIYILAMLPSDDEVLMAQASEAGADDVLSHPLRSRVLAVRLRAGKRMVALQEELERDREELRRFAAELSISNRRLQEAAMTDSLTGFPNRRYAIERMQTEWSAAERHGRPLSAMIIDVDGFKLINDTHGHDVGDMALRQCADALRAVVRAHDVICRTGGDEFLVICPDTDLVAALICAERLRGATDALSIDTGGPQLRLTISIGVATREALMADMDALIKCADQAAYQAKRLGRNRVAVLQNGGKAA